MAGLESDMETLEWQIETVTQAGDPDGQVRGLSRERRELRAKIEDAQADLAAQDAAVTGAVRSEGRAILEAMDEVWSEQPVPEAEERVRATVGELGAALDELATLSAGNKHLQDWSDHLVGRVLNGEAQAPALPLPDVGIHAPDLAALARAVSVCRENVPAPEEVTV